MDTINELSDHDKRKRNMIVYNLPESKNNSDAFVGLCSSVYSCSFAIARSVRLGKKIPDKHKPLLLSLLKEKDKFKLLSPSYLLRHNESYKNVYVAPDRTKGMVGV